jgi:glyoxylase-like metal-dependent hydrolase (beta-lactamase superfamily II)
MTTLIAPRVHDLGGFQVRRAVRSLQARSVGPFVFVDHMGPAIFEPGRGIDVRPIGDGDVVEIEGATLEAFWTPGHARDHLCFLLREEKALFTGDNILGAGTTVIPPDGDLGDYLDSLARIQALDIERIFPAHGPAIEDPHKKISDYLAHRALRDEQILEAMNAGLRRTEDMVKRIYTDVPEFLHRAAGVSVESHLRRFAKLGRARRDGEDWLLV